MSSRSASVLDATLDQRLLDRLLHVLVEDVEARLACLRAALVHELERRGHGLRDVFAFERLAGQRSRKRDGGVLGDCGPLRRRQRFVGCDLHLGDHTQLLDQLVRLLDLRVRVVVLRLVDVDLSVRLEAVLESVNALREGFRVLDRRSVVARLADRVRREAADADAVSSTVRLASSASIQN
jgi:hypothetical protein